MRGNITVALANTSSWQYDEENDRVIYAYSGPDHRKGDPTP
jgi:hypothetical protein